MTRSQAFSQQNRPAATKDETSTTAQQGPAGTVPVLSPMQGCVVDIEVMEGDEVIAGQKLVVLESMKMEHVITADRSGYVRAICVARNKIVAKDDPLVFIEEADISAIARASEEKIDLNAIRADLDEVIKRHAYTLDENRPEAAARRRKKNQRTARENIEDLCDPDSFIEYGALIVAAQRNRSSLEELMKKTPGGRPDHCDRLDQRSLFDDEKARCLVMAYDYTVLAGTQGLMGHKKMDRMLHIANEWRLPTVLFAGGGGGRPGDIGRQHGSRAGPDDVQPVCRHQRQSAVDRHYRRTLLRGQYCAGGTAATCIIATKNSNIGMGGPAMIEGGGLGVVRPEDIGPIDVQTPNGVVDIAVEDEVEAVAVAKKYLSYFQGAIANWEADGPAPAALADS